LKYSARYRVLEPVDRPKVPPKVTPDPINVVVPFVELTE